MQQILRPMLSRATVISEGTGDLELEPPTPRNQYVRIAFRRSTVIAIWSKRIELFDDLF